VNIDNLGDPFSGYIVWGVNATGQAINTQVFPESLVQTLLPAPPMPAPGTRSVMFPWRPEAATADDR